MECHGKGELKNYTEFTAGRYTELKTNRKINIIYPEVVGDWLPAWVVSTIEAMKYISKRDMYFFFLTGKIRDGSKKSKPEIKEGFNGFFLHPNHIFIIAPKKEYSYLTRANPDTGICSTLFALGKVIWHEIYHFKSDRGKKFPSKGDLHKVSEIFWDRREREVA